MTWGWLIAMVGIQCVALGMAEICSSMPTSGGLYYAAAVLAPPGWGPIAAWITGWSNWLAQITAAPSINYGNASMILAAASIQNPGYVPTNWQVYLLTALIMVIHCGISSMPTRYLAQFNAVGKLDRERDILPLRVTADYRRLDIQHDCPGCCHHTDTKRHDSRGSRSATLHAIQRGMGHHLQGHRLARWYRHHDELSQRHLDIVRL